MAAMARCGLAKARCRTLCTTCSSTPDNRQAIRRHEDFNGAQQEGFGPYQRTIHEGERWSASFAYLRPIEKERPNLTILSTALVSKVVFHGGKVHGVETVAKPGAEPEIIHATQEVILCAGAVQSPQILQLSGIGPADALRKHGVTCVYDSKNVGANLQDHLDVTVIHEMTEKASAYSKQAGLKKLAVGIKYLMSKSGPGADNFLQAGAFLKTREGLDRPDIQLHLVNAMMRDHGNYDYKRDGFTIHSCQLRPESRGTVTIASNDPFDHPAIDPKLPRHRRRPHHDAGIRQNDARDCRSERPFTAARTRGLARRRRPER